MDLIWHGAPGAGPTVTDSPHPKPAKAPDGKRLHALAVDEPAAEVVTGHGHTGNPPVEPAEPPPSCSTVTIGGYLCLP